MHLNFERFATITALLAASTSVALGCSSEDEATTPRSDAAAGSSGKSGGKAGASGSSGTSSGGSGGGTATGGASGSSGGAGTGGVAGGSGGTGGVGGASGATSDGSAGQAGSDATATGGSGGASTGGSSTGGSAGTSGTAGTGGTSGTSGTGGVSGTSGSGGSTSTGGASGSGGTGGASGSGGTNGGGTGGVSGSGGGWWTDAGTCFGDTAQNPPDAGYEGICYSLPYATTLCSGVYSYPMQLCQYLEPPYGAGTARDGVFEAMFACLSQIGGNPCDASADAAVQACVDAIFPQACQTGPIPFGDGGGVTCADLAATCPPSQSTAGFTEADCNAVLNAFVQSVQTTIVNCYNVPASLDCRLDFENCVFNF